MAVWEKLPVGSWTVPGVFAVTFPVMSIQESREHRTPERERPYRMGAKFDSTGWKARRWNLKLVFENSIEEPASQGLVLYPGMRNRLIQTFDSGDTGDLFIPTRGVFRAKALTYSMTEDPEQGRDACFFDVTWAEDSEESIDASTFQAGSPNGSARRLAEETRFSAESAAAWGGSLASLNEFVSEIEGIANAPGQNVQDLVTRLRIIRNNAKRIETVFSDGTKDGRDLLLDPENHILIRKLREITGMARRAEGTLMKARPQTVDYVATNDTTLQQISISLRQSYEDLLELNQYRLADPADIEAGTVLRVFEVRQ